MSPGAFLGRLRFRPIALTREGCGTFGREDSPMRRTQTRTPTGPVLVRTGVVSLLGAGLATLTCGGRTESTGVAPTSGSPTPPPTPDAGPDGGPEAGHDASEDGPVDSGFRLGVYDASGRDAADAIAEAASDGHIFEPPCGKKAPPRR
jgi:hypothetical protein